MLENLIQMAVGTAILVAAIVSHPLAVIGAVVGVALLVEPIL